MSMKESGGRNVRRLVLVFGAVLLSGCTNLMYGERTGFNLGVFVNADPAKPVKINSGLERSVGTVAPPVSDGGEAVSMVSNFKLTMTDEGLLTRDTLIIVTNFASGAAATGLAPGSAQEIFSDKVSYFAETETTKRINAWIAEDKGNRLSALRDWLATWNSAHKTAVDEVDIRSGRAYESERVVAINELQVTESERQATRRGDDEQQ